MPENQSPPPQDPKEPIAARTLNLTRVTGLAGVIAVVATGLSTALGAFQGEPVAVIVAAFAVIAVAMAVTGYVFATDMRVRNRQVIADNYIRYLSGRVQVRPVPQANGREAHLMAPGVPTRVKLIEREDDPIWNLLAVKVDVVDDALSTSFLAGNGQEPPGWFEREHVRVLDPT